jgi:hypothetical protein
MEGDRKRPVFEGLLPARPLMEQFWSNAPRCPDSICQLPPYKYDRRLKNQTTASTGAEYGCMGIRNFRHSASNPPLKLSESGSEGSPRLDRASLLIPLPFRVLRSPSLQHVSKTSSLLVINMKEDPRPPEDLLDRTGASFINKLQANMIARHLYKKAA